MPKNDPEATSRWLIEAWNACLGTSLEALTGEMPEITRADATGADPAGAADEPPLWWTQTFSRPESAALWVGAAPSMWAALGAKALSAAGIEDAASGDTLSSCFEILEQAAAGLAVEIGGKLRQEVRCGAGKESALAPPFAGTLIEIRFSDEPPYLLNLVFQPALTAGLETPPALPAAATTRETPAQTIDVLLDVELPVSVSFGRAYLPLKDVIKLSSGAIVELNRPIADPVEIIVNNCVIARGEVVVVEGNYGVRITQIISRQERLRTLN